MKNNKIVSLFCVLSAVMMISCGSDVPDVVTDPGAAQPVSRLIFTGTASVGGSVKIEVIDQYIERVLDGNPDWADGVLTPLFPLVPHASPVRITINNLVYHDRTISQITCSEDEYNQMSLVFEGPSGFYYDGTDGKLYKLWSTIPILEYREQGVAERITKASLADGGFYLVDCKDTEGNDYEVSLYPSDDILSHSITTTFDVMHGTIEKGIIRVHSVSDGHVPYVDMLL